jgi:hypothetical protein
MDFGTIDMVETSTTVLGLPLDVFCHICKLLGDVRDLGRVAQVGRAWRKASLKDSVWREFGQRLLLPMPLLAPRAAVLHEMFDPFQKNSVFMPTQYALCRDKDAQLQG